jgi:hypothetical protein
MLIGLLLIGALLAGQSAFAQGTPANKFAASGSTREVLGANQTEVILSEQVKMPTNHELIMTLSMECSIITALRLGDGAPGATDAADTDNAEGKIDAWITIDGHPVGVTSTQTGAPGSADDDGQITFCNRQRTVRITDSEQHAGGAMDGIDTFEEYEKSKTANSFSWAALNVGNSGYYDDPANGNNILDVVVYARLEDSTPVDDPTTEEDESVVCELGSQSCSEAIIGNRTLIVEPTRASVVEFVQETGPGPQ